MITVDIYGKIVAQQRPKFARHGNFIQTYDPKPCRDYKKIVQLFANQAVAKQTSPMIKPWKSFCGSFWRYPIATVIRPVWTLPTAE